MGREGNEAQLALSRLNESKGYQGDVSPPGGVTMFAAGSCFCFDMIFSTEHSCFPPVILKFEFNLKKSHCVVIFYINQMRRVTPTF